LSAKFLSDKPLFAHVVEDMLEFLGDAPLIAHNAGFDFSFLNGELTKHGRIEICRSRMVDTLMIARTRHPGAKHTLDALCVRYGIDRSHRIVHGALLDAQLLAQVYVELTGGRQIGLGLAVDTVVDAPTAVATVRAALRTPRPHAATPEELVAHAEFMKGVKEPLWGGAAFG
ncbi:MAG TPA: exonuclease domain-containing protein, partial [Sphingomonas sp.]|nr:exonuclease domain-containing protein [Sphingomonas sp.]